MSKFKFAILGCGRISKKHAEAIANNYIEGELVAVCDIVAEKMDDTISKYIDTLRNNGINEVTSIRKYTDYKEMLVREEDIDIVTIATESGYHARHTIDCINKEKHVIVEKPIALSTTDAETMIKLAKEMNVKLGVCHQNRFNPPVQKLRKAIEKDEFGKLINGTARILWNRNDDYYNQASWRGTWELDGGTLMNQCIHNIDLLQWMMGGEIESVYAQTGTFLRGIEAEDFGAIIIRFKNGAIGIVEGSACVYPTNLEETLSIFGEKGTVVIGGLAVNKIETWKFSDNKEEVVLKDQCENIENVYGFGHTPLIKDFIQAIKEDRDPLVSGEEGKKAMEIILCGYESQYKNKAIKFPINNISTLNFKKIKYE
ncbi:oxidoreductase, NAD-binding rossmann fold family [Gottschalkia purinilytica]|uniref:Oxidoreductase, NAD-binding rossmann fold family n=1 Tax=Gottschalkia purinilytica TaxID=1503 RepID=A0A0L0WDU1_GOTPU|nr:Gfo/Idh/MocA family oxidoreductase [Gottschalkia purinilytica]KNF09643.1 oxidoreductase, NAD-binding rossmann fold family [Gottschalkia purinilytica]